MPETSCRWCGAPMDGGAAQPSGRVRCPRCDVATTEPWPADAELDAAYSGWYRPPAGRFAGPGDALLRRTRARLAARIDSTAPPGPVLDVGSGEGVLVEALRARGREAEGIERGDLPLEARGGQWAAVVFWHSLEHLRDPAGALRHAASLLVPGGVLAVAVPNSASLQARVFGDGWLALDMPRHLFHFTAGALADRLRELGLRVERVSHVRGGQVLFGWLHGLVGLLPGRPSLYDALRRPEARSAPVRGRPLVLAAAVALAPVALACAAVEVLARRGGTVYLEARRA